MVPNRAEKNSVCIEERPERRRDISFCKFPMTSLQSQPISGHPTDPRYCAAVLSGYANTLRQRAVTAGSCSYKGWPPRRENGLCAAAEMTCERLRHTVTYIVCHLPSQAALVPVAAMGRCIGIYTYTFPETYALLFRKAEEMLSKKHEIVTCIGKR